MSSQRNDAYHEIEKRQAGKTLIKKEMKYTVFILVVITAYGIVYGLSSTESSLHESMFIALPSAKSFANNNFNYLLHFSIAAIVSFLIYGVIYPSSLLQKIKEKEILLKKKGKLSVIDNAEVAIWKCLDVAFYWILWPVSVALLDGVSEADRKKIYFRWGWFNALEKGFFKQEYIKTDGNTRASKLILLKKYSEFFSSSKDEKAQLSNEYAYTKQLFKSEKELLDYMRIIEHYLSDKYDKLLSKQEFEDRLKQCDGVLSNFRAFNGKDEVVYSHDLVKAIIDDEAIKFERFISVYAFDSIMAFSRRFRKYYRALLVDVNFEKYLFPKRMQSNGKAKAIVADEEKLKKFLIFALVCYFRFAIWKTIMSQYDNIPAGITVVKMRDYTMRMITEIFEDNTLVSISKNKNDGSTDKFESDNLTNLFLACIHHYKASSRERFDKRIEAIFNFSGNTDEGVNGDGAAKEIMEFYSNEPEGSWIDSLAKDLSK